MKRRVRGVFAALPPGTEGPAFWTEADRAAQDAAFARDLERIEALGAVLIRAEG